MSILLTLAWRNLWLRKIRTVLTIASIMLGVAVILAVNTANRSTQRSIEALFNEAAGKSNLTVESAISLRRALIGFPQEIVQQIQAMPGVVQAVPRLIGQAVYDGKQGPVQLLVQGIDPAVDEQVRIYSLVEGTLLTSNDKGNSVVLVNDLAQKEGVHVGQDVELWMPGGPGTFRVVGILARKNAAVTNGGRVAFISLRVAQDVFNRGRKVDAVDIVTDPAIAQSPALLQQLKEQLQAALGENYTVIYPAAKGSSVTEALGGVQYGLSVFGLFALFASALLIYTTFTMEMAERIREVGMLRLLGTSRTQIAGQLLGSALLLGLIGSGLGLALGFVLAVPLLRFFGQGTGYELVTLWPSLADVAQSFLLGVFVTFVSTLWPMLQASRLSPIESVRVRGREQEATWLRSSWIIGVVLLAIWVSSFFIPQLPSSLMFMVFFVGATFLLPGVVYGVGKLVRRPASALYGYEGSLGTANLERARWRTSTTAAVLMVSIAMGISIGAVSASLTTSIQAWVDRAMSADLFVSSYNSMNSTWGRRLASIQGVAVVSPVRVLDVRTQNLRKPEQRFTARTQAIDPATQEQIGPFVYESGQGDPVTLWATFTRGGSALVSTQLAERYGIRQGDTLRLQTARGAQDLTVAAVIVDYNSTRGTLMITWDDLHQFFGLTDVDMYLVKASPGVNPETVRQQIETQYGRSGHLTVQSNAEVKATLVRGVGTTMLAFNVIVLIAFIIAAFSIVNTMTMSVIERTREIGVLQALGMTRFQVSKMILAEALALGVISGLFGIAFGGVFSRVVVWWMGSGIGFRVEYVLPVAALAISGVLALIVSQLAAIVPARRASGLAVLKALHYE